MGVDKMGSRRSGMTPNLLWVNMRFLNDCLSMLDIMLIMLTYFMQWRCIYKGNIALTRMDSSSSNRLVMADSSSCRYQPLC